MSLWYTVPGEFMNYIVLDLEWNQCPGGKFRENPSLPFEIIEIGAVKLDDRLREAGTFQEVIRPLVYHRLHHRMKEIVPIKESELRHARTFSRVVRDFISWIGPEEYRFVIWGNMDLSELQRNMEYYRIGNPFPYPFLYYDLQKLYGMLCDDPKKHVALEDAIRDLEIPVTRNFHRAFDDAWYTAEVMKKMDFASVSRYLSVDYYRLPKTREEEIFLDFRTYTKYVSMPFPSKEAALADKTVNAIRCTRCKMPVWKRIRWFSAGSNFYLAVVQCPRHGYIKGKIRLKKNADDEFYVVKTLKPVDAQVVESVRERRSSIQDKRRRSRRHHHRRGNGGGSGGNREPASET